MKKIKIVTGLLALFIVTPIWYYLVYRVLESVNATSVMWFLYWVYAPFGIFIGCLKAIIDGVENGKT
jgi:hypothetical protein